MFERGFFFKAFCHFATSMTQLENIHTTAREMAQGLRALLALLEDHGSIPSMHMAAHNHLQIQSLGI